MMDERKQKKLMILGGSRYIVPIIQKAHDLGIYVITCDYLPDNVAHKYSDQYINISIIDKDLVLSAAREQRIDGIMSFACDPGVITAAYVAESLSLPFQCSYKSALILQDKGLFRNFLRENGFNTPNSKRYTDKKTPYNEIDYFNWPVIVKPTDSAGSKGVTKVEDVSELSKAIDIAIEESHNNAFIIEDFITFAGFHSSADPFSVDGELKFVTFSDQLFDSGAENAYTPAYIIWPTTMSKENQSYLTKEIQRLITLLGMSTGIYNIETCVGIDGRPYIMEVSPRGGGCKIAEIQEMAMGVSLIENEIRKAIGMPLTELTWHECDGVWCEMIVHSQGEKSGILKSIEIDSDVQNNYLRLSDISACPGDMVSPFSGANMSLGDVFLQFEDRKQLNELIENPEEWLRIDIE